MPLNSGFVTQGFREDCTRLITRFEQLETVRYDGFSAIWREMKFSLVFAGRRSYVELLEFCEDCLIIGKEFFLPPLSFKERIGGLYLLYGLYFKMPLEGPKIRVRHVEWQEIIEFRAEIGQAEHHDASYILSKLMSTNAFSFTLLDQELGLKKNYRLRAGRIGNPYSVLPEIRELAVPNYLFDRIKTLSEQYERAKVSEAEGPSTSTSNISVQRDLRLYNANLGDDLLNSVIQFEKSRKITPGSLPQKPILNRFEAIGSDEQNKRTERTSKRSKTVRDRARSIAGLDCNRFSSEDEEEVTSPNPFETIGALPDFFDSSSSSESSITNLLLP